MTLMNIADMEHTKFIDNGDGTFSIRTQESIAGIAAMNANTGLVLFNTDPSL